MPRAQRRLELEGPVGVAIAARGHQLVVGQLVVERLGGIAVEAEPARARATAAPFCSDSGNVRPMAMASPTDCIWVPSTPAVPGNFSNAHRGILVTT